MALRIEQLDAARHNRAAFCCGEESLDSFLRRYAAQNMKAGFSTVHVYVDDEAEPPIPILGYYALSVGELHLESLQVEDQKRLPKYPVPIAKMGRLAVATEQQGKGIGDFLVGDAVNRCLDLRDQIGVHALVVDALDERRAAFYEQYGFRRTTDEALTLYLPLGKAGKA
jgi:GNAT superfamily N-acetyltransferase